MQQARMAHLNAQKGRAQSNGNPDRIPRISSFQNTFGSILH
jgi:hypothetical protein